jgi:hypothetical protein
MSPPPRERKGDRDEQDEPSQRHPISGVETHEVGAEARLRAQLIPAPSAVLGAVDLAVNARTGAVALFADPGIAGAAWCSSLCVRHEGVLLRGQVAAGEVQTPGDRSRLTGG